MLNNAIAIICVQHPVIGNDGQVLRLPFKGNVQQIPRLDFIQA